MGARITVDQLATTVMRAMEDYADTTTDGVKSAVRKAADVVKKGIEAGAPVRTGKYAKSWATKTTGENSHALEITVHSRNRYQLAHLLEHGHAKRGGGRVAARPHIAAAEAEGIEELERLIERSIRNG